MWLYKLCQNLLDAYHANALKNGEGAANDKQEFIELTGATKHVGWTLSYEFTARDTHTAAIDPLWVVINLREGNAWLSNSHNRLGPKQSLSVCYPGGTCDKKTTQNRQNSQNGASPQATTTSSR
jgi:hypothetical protein